MLIYDQALILGNFVRNNKSKNIKNYENNNLNFYDFHPDNNRVQFSAKR